jgi:integrase
MAGQIIQRGERTWLVRVYVGRDPRTGKRVYENKTIHGTKKEAQGYLNGALRERDLGTFAPRIRANVGELLDGLLADYKTNGKSYEWAEIVVRVHLRPYFGSMKAAAVGTDYIQAYIDNRRKPSNRETQSGRRRNFGPAENATINRELALLRRAYTLGKSATPPKVSSVPTIPVLKENNVRKGFFEDDAFIAIRRELPEEIRPVITFAYYTGCRKGEILRLQWSQVDLVQRLIRLEPGETKNDDARTIFLPPQLFEMLSIQKLLRDRCFPHCPWVFFRAGHPIRAAWESACRKSGLLKDGGEPARVFHDLRRTGVRNLIRAGVPERVAMMISGHKTRAVFDRYNIVSESDLKEAARRLGQYVSEKSVSKIDAHTRHPSGRSVAPGLIEVKLFIFNGADERT